MSTHFPDLMSVESTWESSFEQAHASLPSYGMDFPRDVAVTIALRST